MAFTGSADRASVSSLGWMLGDVGNSAGCIARVLICHLYDLNLNSPGVVLTV